MSVVVWRNGGSEKLKDEIRKPYVICTSVTKQEAAVHSAGRNQAAKLYVKSTFNLFMRVGLCRNTAEL